MRGPAFRVRSADGRRPSLELGRARLGRDWAMGRNRIGFRVGIGLWVGIGSGYGLGLGGGGRSLDRGGGAVGKKVNVEKKALS